MLNANQWVIAGLGNPGKQYEWTRHNIGFMTVRKLAETLGCSFKEDRSLGALSAKAKYQEASVHLLLPMSYMNLSGIPIKKYLDYYQLTSDQLVTVTDEISLPYGEMKLHPTGGSGGHNGLKSVEQHLGTRNFYRLRMGIGAPKKNEEGFSQPMADYVLSPFTKEEMNSLESFVQRGAKALERILVEPISRVMNDINTRISKQQPPIAGQEKKHESEHTKPL